MKRYLLMVCLCGTLSIGCVRSDAGIDGDNTIAVSTTRFAPVESFFSGYNYTVLETSDSCILHGNTIFHTSEKYIVAYSEDNGFDIFDRSGKHITHFNNFGQGPGEATLITDYYISGDELVCVPFMQPKLLMYSVKTGALTREIELPDTYYYASCLSDDSLALSPLYSNQLKWNVSIYDAKNETIVNNYLAYEHLSSMLIDGFNVFVGRGDKSVFGVLPFDYNLYEISADSCYVKWTYKFDTDEQIENVNPKTANISALSDQYRYNRVVKWLGKYCETKSGAHYQHFNLLCDYGVKPFLSKFDGKSSKSETMVIGVDTYKQFPYLITAPFEMKDGYYICATDASTILSLESSQNLDTFVSQGLQADSNPVIFFYKLQ